MKKKQNSNYSLAHVLYQKLGTDWYAFTEVDGDCFMTKVDSDDAEAQLRASQQASAAEETDNSGRKRRAA